MSPFPASWIALSTGLSLLVGLALLVRGMWPRRRGDVPHCRKCGYNLTGLSGERCPECGAQLIAEAIVLGERRRRPAYIVVGLVLCLLGTPFFVHSALQVNWYRFRPTAWVIDDLQSQNRPRLSKAMRELDRRIKTGPLSASHRSRLIDLALKAQRTAPPCADPMHWLIQYLGDCYFAGHLSEKQKRTMFEHVCYFRFTAEHHASHAGHVQVGLKAAGRAPHGLYVSVFSLRQVLLDGNPTGFHLPVKMQDAGATGGSMGTGSGFEFSEPGHHRLSLALLVEVYERQSLAKQPTSRPIYTAEIPLEATFQATEATDYVKLVKDPSLKDALHRAITPGPLVRRKKGDNAVQVWFKVEDLPANVLFEVFTRVVDGERRLTNISGKKGDSWDLSRPSYDAPDEDTVDVVLRTMRRMPRKHSKMTEIWDGELVYEGVKIIVAPDYPRRPVFSRAKPD